MSERRLRNEIAAVCRRIYEKGFVAATDGNVTARLDAKRILATPSGVSKHDVTPQNLIVCDMDGRKLSGVGKPTSELRLHLAVYNERPDLRAAVHAHPPYATALTVAGVSLADPVLPEVLVSLGRISTTEYATPSSAEGPRAIRKLIKICDALLLDRHGALAAGRTPWEAYYRLEKVEHAAQILFLAHELGKVRKLTRAQIRRIVKTASRHGLAARITRFEDVLGKDGD
jgi:L-fuculose-phosphate aldolase